MISFNVVPVNTNASETAEVIEIGTFRIETSCCMAILFISSGFKMICSNKRGFNEF